MPLKNKATIPSGMLNPAGLTDTPVNPDIQSTTRPPGVLLQPSPGYDSVRVGKNRFQGKGPTGGFRKMEYAEEVGGTGAALSVVPGSTAQLDETEWLPENQDSVAVVIADRELKPGWAARLHGGLSTIPDMGDRKADRPNSRNFWSNLNPTSVLRDEYRKSPALSVAMGAGLVYVVYLLANEAERQFRSPRGVGTAVTSVPAAGTKATGEVAGDTIDKIGEAGDNAVKAIESAADEAVTKITQATEKAKETVSE